jgi:hypothetical protein
MIRSMRIRWVGHVTCIRNKRSAYRILVGNPEGNKLLERPRLRCGNNIKIDLRAMGWGGMDWIDLAQDRDQWMALANTVINLRVPKILRIY